MQAQILKKNHQTISKSIVPILASNRADFNGYGQGPATDRIRSELHTMQQHIRLLQWQAQEYNQVKADPSCYSSFNGPRALRPELQTVPDQGKVSARSVIDERAHTGKIIKDDDVIEDEPIERTDDIRPSYFARHSMGTVQGRNASRASG